jgi:hypothetical protein
VFLSRDRNAKGIALVPEGTWGHDVDVSSMNIRSQLTHGLGYLGIAARSGADSLRAVVLASSQAYLAAVCLSMPRSLPPAIRSAICVVSLTGRAGGQQGQQDIPHELIIGRQMWLGIAMEARATGSEALQVHDGWHHALASEAVECPEQHAIELALVGILE